jgi:guanylate kinase
MNKLVYLNLKFISNSKFLVGRYNSHFHSIAKMSATSDSSVASVESSIKNMSVSDGSSSSSSSGGAASRLTPIVFAGPSGVGKGTVIKALQDKYPDVFGFSVSHTTRAPRAGEEHGVHYYFSTKEDMVAGIARNEFVESANVHTNMYGTSIMAVEQVQSKGKICLLDIDIQGCQSVKKSSITCKFVFIMPPSKEELEKRLRGRGTETEEKIQVRLNNSAKEIEYGEAEGNFDLVVKNDDLDRCLGEISKTFAEWYPELKW